MEHVRYHRVLNLVYECRVEGTDVPKHVVVVKDPTFKCARNLSNDLVSQLNVDSLKSYPISSLN
jgi:hypothetical protein